MSGGYIARGSCFACGRQFAFNPSRVPSVTVDIATGRPPDVDAAGNPQAIDPDVEVARRPICRECVGLANVVRERNGREPIAVLPGAYDYAEGFPP
jgi:hypothetical protein